MDNYKKLQAVRGLIISLDEQIYRLDHIPNMPPLSANEHELMVNQYYNAIKDLLNENT